MNQPQSQAPQPINSQSQPSQAQQDLSNFPLQSLNQQTQAEAQAQAQPAVSISKSPLVLPDSLSINDLAAFHPFIDPKATYNDLPAGIDTNKFANYMQFIPTKNNGQIVNSPPPKGFDPTKGYGGFVPSQCTSYASWYLNSTGRPWVDSSPGQGNAKNWGQLAAQQGYNVSKNPSVGSVAVFPNLGPDGHVAVVQGVNPDGTINVNEWNYKPGQYSQRNNVSSTDVQFIS